TLNPIKHLDPFGSVLIPALTYFLGGFIFGWAKPVPYNPYNLKNQKWGPAIVAAAGPFSNLIVAIVFGLIVRLAPAFSIPAAFVQVSILVVFINLILMIFNLVPLPPLDGSKVLFALLPIRFYYIQQFLEQYGFFLIIIFIFFFWSLILPAVFLFFKLITGIGFSGF
ncbi:MAG: site-2 protease family protein, partial [Patescibacteria group bacterium]